MIHGADTVTREQVASLTEAELAVLQKLGLAPKWATDALNATSENKEGMNFHAGKARPQRAAKRTGGRKAESIVGILKKSSSVAAGWRQVLG